MIDLLPLAAPQASNAGVLTSIASIITALTVLLGSIIGGIKVLYPMLRETRALRAEVGIVHTLVNSTLTAAQQAALDQARMTLLALQDAARLRAKSGEEVTEDQTALIGEVRRKIDELSVAMKDRLVQTRLADIQIETEARRVK